MTLRRSAAVAMATVVRGSMQLLQLVAVVLVVMCVCVLNVQYVFQLL